MNVVWRPSCVDVIGSTQLGVRHLQYGYRGYFAVTKQQVVILTLKQRFLHASLGLLLIIPLIGQLVEKIFGKEFLFESVSPKPLRRGIGWTPSVSSSYLETFCIRSHAPLRATPSFIPSPVKGVGMGEYTDYLNRSILDFENVPPWVCSCKEIMLKAVQQMSCNLMYASEELRANRELVLAAVKCDGMALRYAHDSLKNDKSLVTEAVKQWGLSLQFASTQLRDDLQVVIAAYKQHKASFKYASKRLQTNCRLAFALDQEN